MALFARLQPAHLHYGVITGGYWGFTITDGAIRMLVLLYFHLLGYSPFAVAMLFLFYEFFGIVTNLLGGWLGARIGLNLTMQIGMVLQVVALLMLTVPESWLTVGYVMAAQALSGIAKDLNKMSAKAAVKTVVSEGNAAALFKWVAILTGSKNALKGAGFFIGAALLQWVGFQMALQILAALLFVTFLITLMLLPQGIGQMSGKAKFSQIFSHIPAINTLAAARFFLFASRDIWFVVGLPVYLYEGLHWSFTQIGTFMALWVIGYGMVQALAPRLLSGRSDGRTSRFWVLLLALLPAAMGWCLAQGWPADQVIVVGLILFGVIFAINSALHSYLILAYADHDKVAMSVGFYYMANAAGRLAGTVLSGLLYQTFGLVGCLVGSALFLLAAAVISVKLPDA
ncbi:MAG: organoarsenical effux MFS transporter ArsJ [Gammaproteobacteria bacterium]|nr:organoarsenical effux MFS transporter ArsJ [Gammaproteobacteria bacterium]